jgi:CheY-like chemotaxis protein
MQRVLVLDDNPERHAEFDRIFRGLRLDHVWTAREAIRKLDSSPRYDVAFLDYDLDRTGEPEPGCGLDVAEHVARMDARKRPRRAYVHSWNESGRQLMANVLRAADVPTTVKRFHVGNE